MKEEEMVEISIIIVDSDRIPDKSRWVKSLRFGTRKVVSTEREDRMLLRALVGFIETREAARSSRDAQFHAPDVVVSKRRGRTVFRFKSRDKAKGHQVIV